MSPRDWSEKNPRYNGEGYLDMNGAILIGPTVPQSCCASARDKAKCMVRPTGVNGVYQAGCLVLLYDEISAHHLRVVAQGAGTHVERDQQVNHHDHYDADGYSPS